MAVPGSDRISPILALVARIRTRLWAADLARRARIGLLGATALGTLGAFLLAWLVGNQASAWSHPQTLATVAVAVIPLLAALPIAARRRPVPEQAARIADRELGADGLLLTAWEIARAEAPAAGARAVVLDQAARRLAGWSIEAASAPRGPGAAALTAPILAWLAVLAWLLLAPTGAPPQYRPAALDMPVREIPAAPNAAPDAAASLARAIDSLDPVPAEPTKTADGDPGGAPGGSPRGMIGDNPEEGSAALAASGPGLPEGQSAGNAGGSEAPGPRTGGAAGSGATGAGTGAAPPAAELAPKHASSPDLPVGLRPLSRTGGAADSDGPGSALNAGRPEPLPNARPAAPRATAAQAQARLVRPREAAQRALLDRYAHAVASGKWRVARDKGP